MARHQTADDRLGLRREIPFDQGSSSAASIAILIIKYLFSWLCQPTKHSASCAVPGMVKKHGRRPNDRLREPLPEAWRTHCMHYTWIYIYW